MTSLIKFNPAELIKEEWIAKKESALAEATQITKVTSDADLEISGAIQTSISKLIKKLAAERLNCTRPLDALKKEITALEKKEIAELNAEFNRLKGLNSDYATELYRQLEDARRIAEEKARAEVQAQIAEQQEQERLAREIFGEQTEVIAAPIREVVLPKVEKSKTADNKFVEVFDFEIINSSLIPRAFLCPDLAMIRKHVQMNKNENIIPGVTVISRIDVRSK